LQLDDPANDQQNSDFRASVHDEGVDRLLPAANYRVVTDEELIEELSFPVYRRVSTMIFVPGESPSSVEMVGIDTQDLQAAQERDQSHVA
jgi:hypothetical protein